MPDATPLSPSIGAEISGIDLRDPLDSKTVDWLSVKLVEHKVIFFRDQPLTTGQHLAFARCFGELESHPVQPKPGYPEVLVLHNDAERPAQSTAFWHSDVTWRPEPSLGSILLARKVPAVGGDTLFANMEAAFDHLDDGLKHQLADSRAVHSFEPMRLSLVASGASAEALARYEREYPPVEHPLFRTHPVSGRRSIYVNTLFTHGIHGMPANEAKPILKRLFNTARKPEFQCRFRWQPNSIAFWDNRSAQHYACADYYPAERLMERVTVRGERPF